MILAIDFDGVLHEKDTPIPGRRMGAPLLGAEAAVTALHKSGHTIIIHTVMATTEGGRQAVIDWLRYYDVPFHDVTATKPNADVFLDDKAIRFTDWQQALIEISKLPEPPKPKLSPVTKRKYKAKTLSRKR